MCMTERNIWILIRYYDQHESSNQNKVHSVTEVMLPSIQTFAELKSMVYSWANIKDDSRRVIKLRLYNNSLIPFSALFQGSSKKEPFIVDVVDVHQFCPVQKRIISPGYMNALKSKLTDIEKRVIIAENSISQASTVHVKIVEETISQISNCVEYLDRRLEELAPPDWKRRIGLAL